MRRTILLLAVAAALTACSVPARLTTGYRPAGELAHPATAGPPLAVRHLDDYIDFSACRPSRRRRG
jgi:hypothetical protein